MKKYVKILFTAAAFVVLSESAYAITDTYSIFGPYPDEKEQQTAEIAKMHNPAYSEQARYEFSGSDKIPSVELQNLLSGAERAIDAVIEEHNRRIDIMAMQEVYIKNKHSIKIAEKAKKLLEDADKCNAKQLSGLFQKNSKDLCYGTHECSAQVNLDKIRSEDKWNNYPNLWGEDVWKKGFKPLLIGTYTEKLNEAKFDAGIWWGNAFDPTLSADSVFTQEFDDEDFKKLVVDKLGLKALNVWKGLVERSKDYVGAKGLVNNLNYNISLMPSTLPFIDKKDWQSNFGSPSGSEGGARTAMQEYQKQRWILGYDLLTDIYHKWVYGTPVLAVRRNLWQDQKTRYQQEVMENYFTFHESHYSGLRYHKKPDGEDRPKIGASDKYGSADDADNSDWDQIGSKWPGKVRSYESTIGSRLSGSEYKYTCCKYCSCGKDCTQCCPGEFKLIEDSGPPSHDSGERPRVKSCPTNLSHSSTLSYKMRTPPRPLILNNGKPSVEESVFIDAKISGDKYNGYELSMDRIPDVWDSSYNSSSGSPYTGTGDYIKPKTASETKIKLENFGGEYKQFADSVGKLKDNDRFPFNQNRISAYLDIYEEYVRARNNQAKLVGGKGDSALGGVNGKINTSLISMLQQLRSRYEAGYYDVVDASTGSTLSAFKALEDKLTTTGNFDDPSGIDNLYSESKRRETWFYTQARTLLAEIGKKLREEKNLTTYDYKKARELLLSSEDPDELNDEGDGPRIPSNPNVSLLLYRMGIAYQTLAYFGTEPSSLSDSSLYTPSVDMVQNAMAAETYTEGNLFENKLERIRFEGAFVVPKEPSASKWKVSGSNKPHTSRDEIVLEKGEKIKTGGVGEYIQIGPYAKLSSDISGKSLADLEGGDPLRTVKEKMDAQREERLQRMGLLKSVRANVILHQTASVNDGETGEDFTLSNRNFDSNTCLFKRRKSFE